MEAADQLDIPRHAELKRKRRLRYARDVFRREEKNRRRRKRFNEMGEDERKVLAMKNREKRLARKSAPSKPSKPESAASSSASSGNVARRQMSLPGVITSVPRKILCYDKGIVRWPNPKAQFLSQRSNEEIKHSPRGKQEHHAELIKATGGNHRLSMHMSPLMWKSSSAVITPRTRFENMKKLLGGSRLQNKNNSSAHEISLVVAASQQQGSEDASPNQNPNHNSDTYQFRDSQLQNKTSSSAQEMSIVAAASQQQGSEDASPNQNRNHKRNPELLSFSEVSKLFSLPLCDAADTLGVCSSVLKRLCYENGLVRWPHRKFLRGKSIEEMKKDAARQKQEKHAESPQAARACTIGSSLPNGNTSISDEFKYGFPSDGLSVISYKWWGSRSSDGNDVTENYEENADESKNQLGLLSDLRKQAAEEGKEALRLGVYQGQNSLFKLDSREGKHFFEYLNHHIQVCGAGSNSNPFLC